MAQEVPAKGTKPARSIALVLGLFGPWGIGQFYLGQSKRAVGWLVLPAAVLALGCLALPSLGAVLGYGKVFAVLVLGILIAWAASLIDLFGVPEARIIRIRARAVVGFWVAGLVLTLALRLPIRAFVVEAFKIPSGSMQPTLLLGEHLLADKLAFRSRPPRRGEAVIFASPEHPEQDFIKRVIAVPDDTLVLEHGHPWLNGWEVPHCPLGKATLPDTREGCSGLLEVEYLEGQAYLAYFDSCGDSAEPKGPYRVAPGEVWVLGDNRNNSYDSPSWFGGRGGGVPFDHVKARGLFRWYSPTEWSRYGAALTDPLLPETLAALRPALAKCLASRPPPEKTLPPRSSLR